MTLPKSYSCSIGKCICGLLSQAQTGSGFFVLLFLMTVGEAGGIEVEDTVNIVMPFIRASAWSFFLPRKQASCDCCRKVLVGLFSADRIGLSFLAGWTQDCKE